MKEYVEIFNTGPSTLIEFSIVPRMKEGFGLMVEKKDWLEFKEAEANYHRKLEEFSRRYRKEHKEFWIINKRVHAKNLKAKRSSKV